MAPRKKVHATQIGLLGPDFDQDYHLTKKGFLMPIKPVRARTKGGDKRNRVEAPEAFRHKPKGEQ